MTATHMAIYVAGIALVLLLLGMAGAKYTPAKRDDNPYAVENFDVPNVSSASDVSSGASSLYGWGYQPKQDSSDDNGGEVEYVGRRQKRRCPHCENIYIDKIDLMMPATRNVCRNCDITKNKDIDKYVLKSSVPPCPDMSQYALKNQMPPAGFNPDEWIRKSDIPPCPAVPDLTNYILRSEVPPCDSNKICPKCPECPVCPTCPPCEPKTKVVEKVVYRRGRDDRPFSGGISRYFPRISGQGPAYLPQSLGENYPQAGSIWRPKLSDSNSGFISPDVPMAGNAFMSRRFQELSPLNR
jgi:hypothetical protein